MRMTYADERYLSWLTDPLVTRNLSFPSQSMQELQTYVQKKISDGAVAFWGIFERDRDAMVGTIKLEPIDFGTRTTDFGLMIGDRGVWARGFGTEATKLVVAFAFEVLQLGRVELNVSTTNRGAIRAYEKAGFELDRTSDGTLHMYILNPRESRLNSRKAAAEKAG